MAALNPALCALLWPIFDLQNINPIVCRLDVEQNSRPLVIYELAIARESKQSTAIWTISIFGHAIFLALQLSDGLKQLLLSQVKLSRAPTTQFHGDSPSFSVTEEIKLANNFHLNVTNKREYGLSGETKIISLQ